MENETNEVSEAEAHRPLTWDALAARPLPAEVVAHIEAVRAWVASTGSDEHAMTVWAAFHPAVADIDARARQSRDYNPFDIPDESIVAARETLIRVRDTFLMPTLWASDYIITLSHAIKAMAEIIEDCTVAKEEANATLAEDITEVAPRPIAVDVAEEVR
jgi:hypothetical protein